MRSAVVCCLAAVSSMLSIAPTAQDITPAHILQERVPPANQRFAYGSAALQFGELRLPSSGAAAAPYPVVMIVHGGCWTSELPGLDPRATSLDLMRPMAAALSKIGIATWNVEYRRVGNAGGGWPGTFQDLARATDSLRELAPKYRLDLRRVVVAGHSSGAHLAMWIASRRKLPASSPLHVADPLAVKAIMSIDGPIDPVAFQAVETEVCPNRAMTQFLGGTPAQRPERYRDASPMTFLPLGVPQELIAGGVMTMFRSQLTDYQTAARAKGDSVTVTPLDGAGHFDMLLPGSKYWAIVEDRLLALLRASD